MVPKFQTPSKSGSPHTVRGAVQGLATRDAVTGAGLDCPDRSVGASETTAITIGRRSPMAQRRSRIRTSAGRVAASHRAVQRAAGSSAYSQRR